MYRTFFRDSRKESKVLTNYEKLKKIELTNSEYIERRIEDIKRREIEAEEIGQQFHFSPRLYNFLNNKNKRNKLRLNNKTPEAKFQTTNTNMGQLNSTYTTNHTISTKKNTCNNTMQSLATLPSISHKSKMKSSSFSKMKHYKVRLIKKGKQIKSDELIKELFGEYGVTFISPPKVHPNMQANEAQRKSHSIRDIEYKSPRNNKNGKTENKFIDFLLSKKLNFEEYLQIQSKAEMRLRPKIGDDSFTLLEYLKKIKNIRAELLEDILDEIKNLEDGHREENQKYDTNFKLQDKALIEHKWKNIFTLKEYQNYFLDQLKGKISALNYRQMLKKFKQISYVCFNDKNERYGGNKKLELIDY